MMVARRGLSAAGRYEAPLPRGEFGGKGMEEEYFDAKA